MGCGVRRRAPADDRSLLVLTKLEAHRLGSLLRTRGQHTTVTARLFHLPTGGELIDSPGIREFGLWHISEDELLHGYRELSDLAGHCKFRNCSHRNEPGCALIMAAESGEISEERLANFYQIADTLDEDGRERYQ